MAIRVLAVGEYEKLYEKVTGRNLGDAWTHVHAGAVAQMKSVHRLLCDGHKVEELTPAEQAFAAAFEGVTCVQIPNDYGWEPGINEVEAAEPESKPKKQKRSE